MTRSPGRPFAVVDAVWAGLLVAQLAALMIVLATLHRPGRPPIIAPTSRNNLILFLSVAAFLVVGGLFALVLRGIILGRRRPVPPRRNATASIVFQLPFALAAIASIACAYLSGRAMPHVGLTGMAVAIQVLARPGSGTEETAEQSTL